MLLSGSEDYTLKLWDLRTNACVRTMDTGNQVCFADMDANAKVAISSAADSIIKLWDLGSGRCLRSVDLGLGANELPVGGVVMHEGGEAFMVSTQASVLLWSTLDTSKAVVQHTLAKPPASTSLKERLFATCKERLQLAFATCKEHLQRAFCHLQRAFVCHFFKSGLLRVKFLG